MDVNKFSEKTRLPNERPQLRQVWSTLFDVKEQNAWLCKHFAV